MILEICHSWGRPPAWWESLPRADQIRVMGWWRSRAPKAKRRSSAEALADRVQADRRKLREGVQATEQAQDFWMRKTP